MQFNANTEIKYTNNNSEITLCIIEKIKPYKHYVKQLIHGAASSVRVVLEGSCLNITLHYTEQFTEIQNINIQTWLYDFSFRIISGLTYNAVPTVPVRLSSWSLLLSGFPSSNRLTSGFLYPCKKYSQLVINKSSYFDPKNRKL